MVQTKGNPLIGKLSVDITEGVSVAVGKQKCQKLRVFSWIYSWIYSPKNGVYIQNKRIKKTKTWKEYAKIFHELKRTKND